LALCHAFEYNPFLDDHNRVFPAILKKADIFQRAFGSCDQVGNLSRFYGS
jgi:hypothetical protein